MSSADSSSRNNIVSGIASALPAKNLRPRWTHNPMVLSAIACTNMHNCDEVRDVFTKCMKNENDKNGMLCEAAEKYYRMCNGNSNILNSTPYQES